MAFRILHFIDALGAGGAERQLVYLLERLDRRRFESHVVTTYDKFRHYEQTLNNLNIPVYSLQHGDNNARSRLMVATRYTRLMWRLRPNIVHSWLFYPNLIARTARLVCPQHQLITAVRSEYSSKQYKAEELTRWLSDFRVVNNKNADYKSYIYIPNGIDLQSFSSKLDNRRLANKKRFTLLMVARFDRAKDHLTLLKALQRISNHLPNHFQLVLIGEVSDPKIEQQVKTYAKENNLSHLIQQRAPVLNIIEEYHSANISILPSKEEGFPNVILESLATGTPVIASQAANKHQMIQHRVNGWCFPTGDSNALSECLLEAISVPQTKLHQMGGLGRPIVGKYSIEKTVEEYEKLYLRAVSES